MKKAILAVLAASSLAACTSVETTTVSANEVAANGGEAVAVIQGTSIGITALWNIIDIVQSDLDTSVNKLLIAEAKAMGASRIDLKSASTAPRHGIFALTSCFGMGCVPVIINILSFPGATATGVAVK